MTTALYTEGARRGQTDAAEVALLFLSTGSSCGRNDERRQQEIMQRDTQGGCCLMPSRFPLP